MDSNYKIYDALTSFERIETILSKPSTNYEEAKKLPDRDDLTYDNGFYAFCSALFIDIRDSSDLPNLHNRPTLAKIYRAFISEMVAILNSEPSAREVNIVGDCVWAVFNTPQKTDINDVFSLAARANSLMKVLNAKLVAHGYGPAIKAGIGISYGRALMIKAGYNGSGISEVVYMGDVVNQAAKMASTANGNPIVAPVVMDELFRQNLNDTNIAMTSWHSSGNYTADVVNVLMNQWYLARIFRVSLGDERVDGAVVG